MVVAALPSVYPEPGLTLQQVCETLNSQMQAMEQLIESEMEGLRSERDEALALAAARLDVSAILDWRRERGSLLDCPGDFERLTNRELLTRPCEVLIPCATANAVHSKVAAEVQCKLIVEGAHGPVSSRADKVLKERGISVVPDILANGGGVVMSYFEWVQNRMGYSWIMPVIEKRLRRFMAEGWNSVMKTQQEYDVTMRQAASVLAVKRVSAADELRGIYA